MSLRTVLVSRPASDVGSRRLGTGWRVVALVEVLVAVAVVARDLFLPTVLLVVMALASLVVRRDGWSSLGLDRVTRPGRLAAVVLTLTVAWTVVQLAVIMPVLEHVSGSHQDLGVFTDLEGNVPLLVALLVVSWTLAAFGEELAYRGYLRTRLVDLLGSGTTAAVAAAVLSAAVFGLAHSEQGVVGVGATFCDALFFTALARRSSGGLWAAVLAHGFNNTIGLTAYFLVGPIHGLW